MLSKWTWSDRNLSLAFHWYQKSSDQGFATGHYNLALLFLHGDGINRNMTEAVRLISLAANQGCRDAQRQLGQCYRDGRGVARVLNEARKWFQVAKEP